MLTNDILTRLLFAVCFLPFMFFVGDFIHRRGRTVLDHTFGEAASMTAALSSLLRIGWYLVCGALLLWNLGLNSDYPSATHSVERSVSSALVRLGIAILVVGFLHSFNILSLSLFQKGRKT
jgi:hypothetical protein